MPEPVRILYTIPNFITAGSGRALVNIIQRLDRKRFAPSVCVARRGGKLETVLEGIGVPVIEHATTLHPKPYATLLPRAYHLAAAFKPYHFDLWHSFHYADDYTEPVIARLAGASAWVYTKKNMAWNRRSWWLRSCFASAIAAQNSDMLHMFFTGPLFQRKTRLIQRGVDLQRFSPRACTGDLRAKRNIPWNATLIGCVAQLVPVKGHLVAIAAMAHLRSHHMVFAGGPFESEYSHTLLQTATHLGVADRIHFLGDVEDIPGFLAEMDIVILPTLGRLRMEGCPVALLEAMACAKACVATDIPGSRDLIESGVSGLLIPPEDASALADAVERLSNDDSLRKNLGLAARKRVEAHFSIEREVSAHQSFYDSLLLGHPVN